MVIIIIIIIIVIIVIIEQLFLLLFLILFYLYLTFTVAKTTSEPGDDMSSEGTQSDQEEGENLEGGAASKTESKLLSVSGRRAKMVRKFWL